MKKIILLFLTGLLMGQFSKAQNCIIADFPLNGNAQDISGNSNHGTFVGNPTSVSGHMNVANSAYSFTLSDAIEINDTLGNFGTSDFTISSWIKTTVGGSGKTARFISKREACNTAAPFIQLGVGTMGNLIIELNETNSYAGKNTGEIVNDGSWHHIVIVRQGVNHKCYIDNSFFVNHTTPTVYNYVNNATLEFAKDVCINVNTGVKYTGDLDNIKFYNCALGDSKIDSLYRFDFPVSVQNQFKSNLVVYPNPTSDQIVIKSEGSNGKYYQIEIVNILGKTIYKFDEAYFPYVVNFGKHSARGLYFLKIRDSKNRLLDTRKINLK
jgi:hypothetical protein